MQDYQRNGWYAVAALLGALSASWLANWGNTVASAAKDSTTHFLIPTTYAALAGCAASVLMVVNVMFNVPSKLWRHRKRNQEASQQATDAPEVSALADTSPRHETLGTVTLDNFVLAGNSELEVRSSAETFAKGGGALDQAKLRAEHFPGLPEWFSRPARSQDE